MCVVERGVKPVQDSVVERHGTAVDLDDPEVDSVDRPEALSVMTSAGVSEKASLSSLKAQMRSE